MTGQLPGNSQFVPMQSASPLDHERPSLGLLSPRLSSLSSLLFTLSSPFGRSGLRPSLVRGDSPRNAPLKTRAAATLLKIL